MAVRLSVYIHAATDVLHPNGSSIIECSAHSSGGEIDGRGRLAFEE